MAITWGLTIDCADPQALAAFWSVALGYVAPPPPAGYASWDEWAAAMSADDDDDGDGAFLVDPDGVGPTLSFLEVPEPKTVKNRVHVDVKVGGGREQPWEQRWPRVQRKVEELLALGARVVAEHQLDGRGDHVVLADPEGNEFCVV